MESVTLTILLALILLGIMAFFSLAEAAVSNARRQSLEEKAEDSARARAAINLMESPGNYISTAQVGSTLAGFFVLAVGAVGLASPLEDWLEGTFDGFVADHSWAISLLLITLILGSVCFVIGELIPDAIGTEHANSLVQPVARPLQIAYWVLRPVVWLLTSVSNLILRVFRSGERVSMPNVTEAEILALVEAAHDGQVIDSSEADLVEDALQFGDTLVRSVMVPRVDVASVSADAPLREAVDQFFSTGYSRLPVYQDTPDDVAGVLYMKDVLKLIWDNPNKVRMKSIRAVRPAYVVPESKPIDELLSELRRERTHIAMIYDEYGGLAGIVTLEDLLEELVGEITDEFDPDEVDFAAEIEPGVYEVDGSLQLLDLVDQLDLEREGFDELEADSVSGLFAERLGRIPDVGDQIEIGDIALEVLSMDGHRVGATRVTRNQS